MPDAKVQRQRNLGASSTSQAETKDASVRCEPINIEQSVPEHVSSNRRAPSALWDTRRANFTRYFSG